MELIILGVPTSFGWKLYLKENIKLPKLEFVKLKAGNLHLECKQNVNFSPFVILRDHYQKLVGAPALYIFQSPTFPNSLKKKSFGVKIQVAGITNLLDLCVLYATVFQAQTVKTFVSLP